MSADPTRLPAAAVWALRIVAALAAVGALGLLFVARMLGAHWNLLLLFWMAAFVPGLALRAVGAWRGWLDFGLYRGVRPWPDRAQALIRIAAWIAGLAAVQAAMVHVQFTPADLLQTRIFVAVAAASAVGGAAIPIARRQWTVTAAIGGAGLLFAADLAAGFMPPPAPTVALASPFRTPATVFHGGGSPLLNHHAPLPQQRHALDLVLAPGGSEIVGDPNTPEGYACFGAEILAPAAGVVTDVRDDRPDNPPGEVDLEVIAGNTVVVEIAPERYLLLAHLKQGSARVAPGQRVEVGDVLAECGNTGNTSQPHLHLQVQNTPGFSNADPTQRTFGVRWARLERGGRVLEARAARRNDVILP